MPLFIAFAWRLPAPSRVSVFPSAVRRLALTLALLCLAALPAQALEQLSIDTGSGSHPFQVEVQRTQAELERGLMHRRYLPDDRGMLFDFKTVRPIVMWMKNTFIPLDMLFIGADGHIVGIAENTEPESERLIPSGEPALAVLEVKGGTAARIGAKVGDRVNHPMFSKAKALN